MNIPLQVIKKLIYGFVIAFLFSFTRIKYDSFEVTTVFLLTTILLIISDPMIKEVKQ